VKINFVTKKDIPAKYLTQVRVSSGYVNVSCPELTGFDILSNALFKKSKNAGIKFRKYPLSVLSEKKYSSGFQTNDKWKISINEEIDIDDL
jgi:hypothetical protein